MGRKPSKIKERSKPRRTPMLPWSVGFPAPNSFEFLELPASALLDSITLDAQKILKEAGLPTDLAEYEKAEVRQEVGRLCEGWRNEAAGTWSSPPLLEAAETMRYAHWARVYIEAGNALAAAWSVIFAGTHAQRLQSYQVEPAYLGGSASRTGAKRGGVARTDNVGRAALLADLAVVEGERPRESDAEYARMIARRRGQKGTEAINKAARRIKVQIHRWRPKKPVSTGAT